MPIGQCDAKDSLFTLPSLFVRFKILTALKTLNMVFSAMMPCGPLCDYRCFEGMYCLHLQGEIKVAALTSFETLLTTYKTTMRHYPDDYD